MKRVVITKDGSAAGTEAQVASEAVYDDVKKQPCRSSEDGHSDSETLTTFLVLPAGTECSSSAGGTGLVDLGALLQVARGSFDRLKQLAKEMPDVQTKQYLSLHFKYFRSAVLHSHQVTKKK